MTVWFTFEGREALSCGADVKAGDTICTSVGHPIRGGEFTTYRLGLPIGVTSGPYGAEPVFAVDDLHIEHDGTMYRRDTLMQLRERDYEPNGFGGWRKRR
jgi:hypothetical protein